MTTVISSRPCVYIERSSTYLLTLVNKYIAKNKRNFMVIDVSRYTVFIPKHGVYECSDIYSLKGFTSDMLKKIDVDRIYIAKNIDEKWLTENLYLFSIDASDSRNYVLESLGKILNIVTIKKKRGFLSTKRIEPEAVLGMIDLYTKY